MSNAKWVPAVGELFYIKHLNVIQEAVRNGVGDTIAVVKRVDKSYDDDRESDILFREL
jgi:hypothetical protein